MGNKRKFVRTAILDMLDDEDDWILARELVRPVFDLCGRRLSPISFGHYLSELHSDGYIRRRKSPDVVNVSEWSKIRGRFDG